jgi:D-3-phosphoglycerate dehydrogenase
MSARGPKVVSVSSTSHRVLVADHAWPSVDIERDRLEAIGADLVVAEGMDPDSLVREAAEADGILVNWRQLPAAALEAAPKCLVVSRYGVGVDNIPVERASELGIVVANVPSFCEEEVADHAMALLLASARRIVRFATLTSSGGWDLDGAPGIPRLSERTLGVIGFGRSARCLVARARGFGMKVLVYTPRLRPGTDLGSLAGEVEVAADLAALLERSDYVSLHAPITSESRGMIGEEQLRAMKSDAVLINVSRGGLVDQAALERALVEGWIAGAALDVLEREPPGGDDRELIAMPNVIVTPHVAFYSESAIRTLREAAAENVVRVLEGKVPVDVVNREVLDSPRLRMRRPTA